MADGINAPAQPNNERAQAAPIAGITSEQVRRAVDFLMDSCRIGNVMSHYEKTRRYAPLRLQQMFNSLVGLYEALFQSHWHHFRRLVDAFPATPGVRAARVAARCYISHWFHDLYCSNRDATRAVSPAAFNEHYTDERAPFSLEYDDFLVLLDASIKPTNIKLVSENALWIPIILEEHNYEWDSEPFNPFRITDFTFNEDMFFGILSVMKERKEWRLSRTITNTAGRPCWLFDWHDSETVCAWFPREQNYTDHDVVFAYIIGVACTPKLGPRDIDDWQIIPYNREATDEQIYAVGRTTPRNFYGSYEVRAIERGPYRIPSPAMDLLDTIFPDSIKKRKKSKTVTGGSTSQLSITSSGQGQPATTDVEMTREIPDLEKFRIVDYCYYSRVILYMENHTRTGAHRIIILN